MKSRAELLRSAFLGPDLEIGVPWDELKQPVRDRWEAALKAVQRVPTKVKVRWDVSDDHIKMAVELGTFIRLDLDKVAHLREVFAAHSVIDVPAGVPSVEELWNLFEATRINAAVNLPGTPNLHGITAIRDAVLAGVAYEDAVMTQEEAVQAVVADTDALAKLARIAYQERWKGTSFDWDGSVEKDTWARVVTAILRAAKPVLDVNSGFHLGGTPQAFGLTPTAIDYLNSRIRFTVAPDREYTDADVGRWRGPTGCEHDWYITPDGLGWVAWNEMELPIETPKNCFHPNDCKPVRLVPITEWEGE